MNITICGAFVDLHATLLRPQAPTGESRLSTAHHKNRHTKNDTPRPWLPATKSHLVKVLAQARTDSLRPLDEHYAASLTFGLSPARDASRTSMSRLNWPILPRLMSDTRACVMPSALAA